MRRQGLEEPELVRVVADQQVLGLLVVVEHHLVVLPADAGGLVAAEGRARGVGVVAVRPHPAGLDRPPRAVGRVGVPGPHAGTEAVQRVVGDLIASSKSRNVVTDTTGPKISSWNTRMSLVPLKTVGWT